MLVAQAAKQKDFEKILEILGSVPMEVDPKDFQNPPRMMTEAIAFAMRSPRYLTRLSHQVAHLPRQGFSLLGKLKLLPAQSLDFGTESNGIEVRLSGPRPSHRIGP